MSLTPAQLALSVQSNKGVYALILGSGVSLSAGIPSGWDVIIQLIQKLAMVEGVTIDPKSAEAWYETRFSEKVGYSDVMARLFQTPSERLGAMKSFFEANDMEREDNPDAKRPTEAHRAIARLMKNGFIRVVITTNFDRLLEQALEAEGIQPTVISSANAAKGALPLVHSPCTIIKVNGDYLDIRQLHTSTELLKYPATMTKLLDRVFDDYGLIVCGWSGEWDTALRDAIIRTPNRRYPLAWAHVDEPIRQANELVSERDGRYIPIVGADEFFSDLADAVEALEESRQVDPLNEELIVARLKRLLPNSSDTIRIRDMIQSEVDRVVRALHDLHRPHVSAQDAITPKDLTDYLDKVSVIMGPLLAMAAYCGRWWREEFMDIWQSALSQLLVETRFQVWRHQWDRIHTTPAIMIYYAVGAGLVMAKDLKKWAEWLDTELNADPNDRMPAVLFLHPDRLDIEQNYIMHAEYSNRYRPQTHWVRDQLWPRLQRLERDGFRLEKVYARMELLMAFRHALKIIEKNQISIDWDLNFGMILGVYGKRNELLVDTINELELSSTPILSSNDLKSMNFCTSSETQFQKILGQLSTQYKFREN